MTISELAKVAYDEDRTIKCTRGVYRGWMFASMRFVMLCPVRGVIGKPLCTEDLAADDWYEVKE